MLWVSAGNALSKLMVPVTAKVIVTPDEALALVMAARSEPRPLSASVVTTSDVGPVTLMLPDVPVMEEVTVSVAVIVCVPVVSSVAENVPVPLVNVALAGSVAEPSLLVKCTVPLYPVAVLLNWSNPVTLKLNEVFWVAEAGAETLKCVAGPGFTVIPAEVPVMEEVTVSVAVMVWLPAVFSVTENTPTPLVNVEFAGSVAEPSVLVNCTVPAYEVTVALLESSAVTVMLNATPAVCGDVADTLKCVATPVTVRLAVALFPVPPCADVITLVVLTLVPLLVPVTLTIKLQDALAASPNDERLMLPVPAVALGVPAVTPPEVVRQVPPWPFGVATTSPAGRTSVKAIACTPVDEFGFAIVKVRLVLPPTAMELAPNAFAKVGDGTAFTTMVPEFPVRLFGVSVAVMVWLPAVSSMAENVFVPLINVEFAGSIANASVLEKLTVPVYAGVVLLKRSTAVTVKLNDVPAVCGVVAETIKRVVGPGFTVTGLLVPVMDDVTESVAVMVCVPAVLKTKLNVPVPFVSETPWPLTDTKLGSVLVKFTVPE
jgi:hypothetical protein